MISLSKLLLNKFLNPFIHHSGLESEGIQGKRPLSERKIKDYFKNHSIRELLPYESFDVKSSLFYNNNSTGFILEFPPLVGCSAETEKELSGLFQHTLPLGSSIQFLLWADPKIEPFLESWKDARGERGIDLFEDLPQNSSIFSVLAQKRVDFMRSQSLKDHQSFRNFRCIVSVSVEGRRVNPVEVQELESLRDQVATTFKTLNLSVQIWQASDLLSFLNDILCFDTSLSPHQTPWNPYDSLADQVGVPNGMLQVDDRSLFFREGKTQARSYLVTKFPSLWSLGAMSELIGDSFRDLARLHVPFLIHYGVHLVHDMRAQAKLLTKAGYAEKQAASIVGKYIPSLKREAEEYSLVRSHLEQGERLVQTSLSATIFAPPESFAAHEQTLLNLFRKSNFELQADAYTQLQTILSLLPMMWGEGMVRELKFFSRVKTTLSSECSNLLPIQGEWCGTQSPGMLLSGRRGQVFTWYPFDNDAGNYNVCVVGRSGSGKSVFMQELMSTILSLKGRVFVLDVGRSFEKSCQMMEGEFIEFKANSPLSLNPFTKLKDLDEEGVSDSLTMLKSILSVMASPIQGTTDLESAYLEQAIQNVWQERREEASLTEVANYLGTQEDQRAKDLSLKLFPYTEFGQYGRFFKGEANVSFEKALCVLELEELKERKDLQAVIVQMVILNITNQMFLGDRVTPFGIVFDEAWDMLRGKQSGVFIETLARRLRKYNGSLIVGTQSINDFYASSGAQAAFDNSDWMCLLSQKPESIEQLKKTSRISLTPHMEAQLTSVKTRQGEYAEVMIYGPHGYTVGRLILDPFSKILYSTKAEEFAAVKALTDKGFHIAKAIEQVTSGAVIDLRVERVRRA